MPTTLKPGDRVTITGAGRTGKWPPTIGTVTAVRRNRVYVHWDGEPPPHMVRCRPDQFRNVMIF